MLIEKRQDCAFWVEFFVRRKEKKHYWKKLKLKLKLKWMIWINQLLRSVVTNVPKDNETPNTQEGNTGWNWNKKNNKKITVEFFSNRGKSRNNYRMLVRFNLLWSYRERRRNSINLWRKTTITVFKRTQIMQQAQPCFL